jgi:integrating conjugative element protein (TIGR03759 family)
MKKKSIIIGLLFFSTSVLAANDVFNTVTENSVSQNTTLLSSVVGTAHDWGLTGAEWSKYLFIMHGKSGHYYPNLTPPEVLGINADNPEDLKHFSEVAAKQEHDKIEKELRFNAAFHEAARRLYVAEPIIKPFDFSPYTPVLK